MHERWSTLVSAHLLRGHSQCLVGYAQINARSRAKKCVSVSMRPSCSHVEIRVYYVIEYELRHRVFFYANEQFHGRNLLSSAPQNLMPMSLFFSLPTYPPVQNQFAIQPCQSIHLLFLAISLSKASAASLSAPSVFTFITDRLQHTILAKSIWPH